MNDNFILLKKIKKMSYNFLDYSNNIPKNLVHIKNNLQNTLDKCVSLTNYYIVNRYDNNRIKNKYLKDICAELANIDYFLGLLNSKKVLGKDTYSVFLNELIEIRKIVYGLLKYNKAEYEKM